MQIKFNGNICPFKGCRDGQPDEGIEQKSRIWKILDGITGAKIIDFFFGSKLFDMIEMIFS